MIFGFGIYYAIPLLITARMPGEGCRYLKKNSSFR
jgi:hypothetical protein